MELKEKVNNLQNTLNYTDVYVKKQSEGICDIMCENGFIIRNPDDTFVLTLRGNIASNIAEIHPLILSELMVKWNNFDNFSPIQLVGLFLSIIGILVIISNADIQKILSLNFTPLSFANLIYYRAADPNEILQERNLHKNTDRLFC